MAETATPSDTDVLLALAGLRESLQRAERVHERNMIALHRMQDGGADVAEVDAFAETTYGPLSALVDLRARVWRFEDAALALGIIDQCNGTSRYVGDGLARLLRCDHASGHADPFHGATVGRVRISWDNPAGGGRCP